MSVTYDGVQQVDPKEYDLARGRLTAFENNGFELKLEEQDGNTPEVAEWGTYYAQ